MADIKNYTLNFVFGRRAERGLACAGRKLAFDEVELQRQAVAEVSSVGGA
ncbi:MAG TPA: hypothetical protein VFN64_09470 [Burkholderiaceae bacterium]|nr:hypothetical protein [Burkholderiaceae bacterium]